MLESMRWIELQIYFNRYVVVYILNISMMAPEEL